jgi:hypothetical protein
LDTTKHSSAPNRRFRDFIVSRTVLDELCACQDLATA